MSEYYDINKPFSIENWNKLIQDVNEILQNPPEGTDCEPIEELDEVEDPHLWSVDDIEDVRDALKETCPDIEFSEDELVLWESGIIDEIEIAMEDAWCDCECEDEEITTGPFTHEWSALEASPYSDGRSDGYVEDSGHTVFCGGAAVEYVYESSYYPCPEWESGLALMSTTYDAAYGNTLKYTSLVDRLLELSKDIKTKQLKIDGQVEIMDGAIDDFEDCVIIHPDSPAECAPIKAIICAAGEKAREYQDDLDELKEEFDEKYEEMETAETNADTAAATNWLIALTFEMRFPTDYNLLTDISDAYDYPWGKWLRVETDTKINSIRPIAKAIAIYTIDGSRVDRTTTIWISPGGYPFLKRVDMQGYGGFLAEITRPYLERPGRWMCDRLTGNCLDGTPPCMWGPWTQHHRPWGQSCDDDGTGQEIWIPIQTFEEVSDLLSPRGVEARVKDPECRIGEDNTDEITEYWDTYLNWYDEHEQYDDRHETYC